MISPPANVIFPPALAAKAVDSPELSTLLVPEITTLPPSLAKAPRPFILALPLTIIFVPCPSAKAPIFLYFSLVVFASLAAQASTASILPLITTSPELFTVPPTI